jgi:hypothetical protein
MRKSRIKIDEIVNIAAILVTIASLLASVCWISSGKAGGEANDMKTAALGFMIMRLESSTQASTELVQAQSYLTQAGMYFAEADSAEDEGLKSILNDLGNQSLEMSTFHSSVAQDKENRSQSYYARYNETLESSTEFSKRSDYRSTGALIFSVAAIIASCGVLFKRKEVLYVYIPIFITGLSYLLISLL